MQWASRVGHAVETRDGHAPEQVGVGNAQVLDPDLAVVVGSTHGLDVAHDLPARRRNVDQERGVHRLGDLGLGLGARDQDRELRAARARDEPLVAVDHPVIAVQPRLGLDQGRVGAGYVGLGHREAGARPPVAERLQVLLLLLVRRPVQQGVHVALVGGLAIEGERSEPGLGCLGRYTGHRNVTEAHAAELLGHVGQPQAPFLGGLAHCDHLLDQQLAIALVGLDFLLGRAHDLVAEVAHALANVLDLGGEAEVDGHTVLRRKQSAHGCGARSQY